MFEVITAYEYSLGLIILGEGYVEVPTTSFRHSQEAHWEIESDP